MSALLFRLHPPRVLPRIDWISILVVVALSVGGVATIQGAASTDGEIGPLAGYARRQAQWTVAALALLVFFVAIDYRWLKAFAWPIYATILVALALTLVLGTRVNGSMSWLRIPLGPKTFSIQPSEPAKIMVLVALARYLADRGKRFRGLRDAFVPLVVVGLPIAIVLKQPDFGTASVFLPATAAMFFVAGLRKRVFVLFFLAGVAAAVAGYPHLKDYQKDRILTFLNPGEDALGKGYNVIQAQTALGSGGAFGKGWGKGTQTSFRFLPEYQTDFVFPTLGEQFGFAGCAAVLGLYALLIARACRIAARCPDPFGSILISGMVAILTVHMILNVGMVAGLLPVTGVPLPFFSYGGSFLMTCYAMVGIAVGIGARRELIEATPGF